MRVTGRDFTKKLKGSKFAFPTYFNENEPIVMQPCEAIQCFLRTNMDVLVLGTYVVRRRTEAPHATDIADE